MSNPPNYGPLLHQVAADYACTEVAAFDVRGKDHNYELLFHLTGEPNTDESERQAAISVFTAVVRECVSADKDGVFVTREATPPDRSQFCLVTLARRAGDVVGAAAFVAKCTDASNARELLGCIQKDAQRFREGPSGR